MERTAEFDPTGTYRYWLGRFWARDRPSLALVMLNPSRADHQHDDPTLRRSIRFAQDWGYGSVIVVNLFAFCTASPRSLRLATDPIGVNNDAYILRAAQGADRVLLAWGNHGSFRHRDRAVLDLLTPQTNKLCCVGLTRTGQPRHPLYLPKDSRPIPWPLSAHAEMTPTQ